MTTPSESSPAAAAPHLPIPDPISASHYTSTGCQHGLHATCRKTCKHCSTACRCSCHSVIASSGPGHHPCLEHLPGGMCLLDAGHAGGHSPIPDFGAGPG